MSESVQQALSFESKYTAFTRRRRGKTEESCTRASSEPISHSVVDQTVSSSRGQSKKNKRRCYREDAFEETQTRQKAHHNPASSRTRDGTDDAVRFLHIEVRHHMTHLGKKGATWIVAHLVRECCLWTSFMTMSTVKICQGYVQAHAAQHMFPRSSSQRSESNKYLPHSIQRKIVTTETQKTLSTLRISLTFFHVNVCAWWWWCVRVGVCGCVGGGAWRWWCVCVGVVSVCGWVRRRCGGGGGVRRC